MFYPNHVSLFWQLRSQSFHFSYELVAYVCRIPSEQEVRWNSDPLQFCKCIARVHNWNEKIVTLIVKITKRGWDKTDLYPLNKASKRTIWNKASTILYKASKRTILKKTSKRNVLNKASKMTSSRETCQFLLRPLWRSKRITAHTYSKS